MRIEHYEFGRIQIDGKTLNADVILLKDTIIPNWWRKEGHALCLGDLSDVMKDPPEALVIGTGDSGLMKVPDDLVSSLSEKGIEVHVENTSRAVERYNQLSQHARTAGAFHLTC